MKLKPAVQRYINGLSWADRAKFYRGVADDLRQKAAAARDKAAAAREASPSVAPIPYYQLQGVSIMPNDTPTNDKPETREAYLKSGRAKISEEHLAEVRRVLRDPTVSLAWKRSLHATTKAALEAIGQADRLGVPDEPLNDNVWKEPK